jgi:hypothetical protein
MNPECSFENRRIRSKAPISEVLGSLRCIRETRPPGLDNHGCGRSISQRTATKYDACRSYASFQLEEMQ